MLLPFFAALKDAKVPVSMKEWLHLMEAMDRDVAGGRVEDFYHLSRAVLVKDEKHYDRFDQVFGKVFKGVETIDAGDDLATDIPEDWLRLLTQKYLTDEEKARIEALGGFDALMDTLKQRLEEQKERHQGGSKWIGTGGTSPFGHGGYNPEGVRIGGPGRQGRAVKVWEKREYRNLDDTVELGARNIKVALRRLRRFARQGAPDELDIDGTIDGTARQG
ncbi:MAG: VWA domain-containing protein, partial [Caulobacteraceae bacterium]